MRLISIFWISIAVLAVSLSLLNNVTAWLTWIAVRLPLNGTVADPGAPWPIPQQWVTELTLKTLDPNTLLFSTNRPGCDIIQSAFNRYRKLLMKNNGGQSDASLPVLQTLSVVVIDDNCGPQIYPKFRDDESYTLRINSDSTAILQSATTSGALRGLETFSQLIYLNGNNKFQVNETYIYDYPRYSYRGLMIDTARHFYPVNIIIKILDAMSWDKLNVLHWHLVDDQSFPYQSTTYPNLTTRGAYSPHHVYSQENVSTIINEARLRGIRVIPEFDTPGHTWSWGRSFLSLITPCWGNGLDGGPNVPDYPDHGPQEILNPMLEETYSFLGDLYKEIVQVFPDEYVHLGMDEVYHACWESNPNISEWMVTRGLTDYHQVEQYYATRLIAVVQKLERPTKYMMWQDPIANNVTVDSNTVIEIWKDNSSGPQFNPWQDYTLDTARKGYDMILSAPWYLNMISYGQDWKKYYQVEPDSFTDDLNLHKLMQGGEACAWSEYIDPTNFFSVVWPRASAVAERLWSNKSETDVDSAQFRLDQQRCRFVRRGIEAKPILNGYCGDYEWNVEDENEGPPKVPDNSSNSIQGIHAFFTLFILMINLLVRLKHL